MSKTTQNKESEQLDPNSFTTSEKILDEMTKKFIIRGKPIRVKSRHGIHYEWMKDKRFKNVYEIYKFIMDFIEFEMPEIHNQFEMNTVIKIIKGIFDMFDEYGEITSNGFKKRILRNPASMINFNRKRDFSSIDEATRAVKEKYDVDLALDGTFLMFTNFRNNERETPVGGLGPFMKVFNIIDGELGYAQPEFELILGVAQDLFEMAKQKKDKPYLIPKDELQNPKIKSISFGTAGQE